MGLNFKLCIVMGILFLEPLDASFENELCKQKNPLPTNEIEHMRQQAMYKAELMTSRLYYPNDMCFYTEEICLTSGVYHFASYTVYETYNNQDTIHLFETYKDIYFNLYSIYQSFEKWRTDYEHSNPRGVFAKDQYARQQITYLCSHLSADARQNFLENFSESQILKTEIELIRKY